MLDVLPYPLEKCASSSGLVVKKTGAFSNPQLPKLLILVLLPRMLNRRWSVSIKTERKKTEHAVFQNNKTSALWHVKVQDIHLSDLTIRQKQEEKINRGYIPNSIPSILHSESVLLTFLTELKVKVQNKHPTTCSPCFEHHIKNKLDPWFKFIEVNLWTS